ncbi:MAG: hypothetical protein COB30_010295 [Ectothiorhodospiraceae bacterium]|nr:hypothetical protein [Ectothiorhodospiraceae bacterium]
MGFLKKMFGGASKDAPPRLLEHPRDLNVNDLVKFKSYGPQLLQEDMFKVEEVNTYHYNNSKEFEFVLRGSTEHTIFLSIEDSDGGPKMRMSVKVPRNIWEPLFGDGALGPVIDEEGGHVEVTRCTDPDSVNSDDALAFLAGWTAPEYIRESFAVRGFYHKGDYRNKSIPEDADDCDEMDYYGLESKDEKYALEIEVYDDDTDVLVTYMTDVTLIEEMWPGS